MRRGMSAIGIVGTFVLVVAVVILSIMIYTRFFESAGSDLASMRACEARAAQGGGTWACSADAACSDVTVKAGKYASYLGVPCDPPVDGKGHCCIILPTSRNPPAGAAEQPAA